MGKSVQHKYCKICEEHPLFSLDDVIFLHGRYVTKRELLFALSVKDKLDYYLQFPQAMNYAQFAEWINKIYQDSKQI